MLLSDPSSPEGTTKQLSRKPHRHEQDGEFLKTKKIPSSSATKGSA